jgi:hypothetical protein
MTLKAEHDKQVIEHEHKKVRWSREDGKSLSWHILSQEENHRDRYTCMVCEELRFNHDYYIVRLYWTYKWYDKYDKEYSSENHFTAGRICSEQCVEKRNEEEIKTRLNWKFDNDSKVRMEVTPANKMNYICKGCRKRKSFANPFLTIGYASHDSKDDPDYKPYITYFGRVCSETCFNLFIFKMETD